MVASSPVCKYGWNVSISEDGSRFYRAAWSSSQDAQSAAEKSRAAAGRGDPELLGLGLPCKERLLTFAAAGSPPRARDAPDIMPTLQIREIDGSRNARVN